MLEHAPRKCKVFLVDDHKVVRAGLRQFLEDAPDVEVVGEAATGAEALRLAPESLADVMLLDLRLPDMEGYMVARELKKLAPSIKVLVLTSFLDEQMICETIASGVEGYLLKEVDGGDLIEAVRKIANGESMLNGKVFEAVKNKLTAGANPLERLTMMEMKMLKLVAEGRTNKAIGEELGLSDRTVRNYWSSVMDKLKVTRRSEAAAAYVRHQARKD